MNCPYCGVRLEITNDIRLRVNEFIEILRSGKKLKKETIIDELNTLYVRLYMEDEKNEPDIQL